jgi:hypothetical protein
MKAQPNALDARARAHSHLKRKAKQNPIEARIRMNQ